MISPDDKRSQPSASTGSISQNAPTHSCRLSSRDSTTLKVLMLGYMNREAFDKTLESGRVTFSAEAAGVCGPRGKRAATFSKWWICCPTAMPTRCSSRLCRRVRCVTVAPKHASTLPKARDLRAGWHGLSISAILICPTIPTPPACLSKGSKDCPEGGRRSC